VQVYALGLLIAALAGVLLRSTPAILERRLAPATLVRLCTAAAVVDSAALGCSLAALALSVAGRETDIAALGRWSSPALRSLLPGPPWLGVAAGLALAASTAAGLACLLRIATWTASAERAGSDLGSGPLFVLRQSRPLAYTLAGLRYRVVVTTGMLAQLEPDEQKVVLAHELSHRRHRHHAYVQCAELAAAINPLLRPLRAVVRHGVERWADEDAAAVAGSRRTAARAIAHAGLAASSSPPTAALSASSGRVGDRASALLCPPPTSRRLLPAAIIAATVVIGAIVPATAGMMHSDFEDASHVASPKRAHHDHPREAWEQAARAVQQWSDKTVKVPHL
jgi:hypothetical protein